ncbi:MAG: zinc-ribbon domain-containing protein [Burkholderiaceae bacterium]|nr:zinc-ribbon domain-containing protein [Burkholderiaceae bacterium]MEB2350870.1 DUF3426 domain-containing protein [Burkholderiaceae bacterium]
MALATTCPQCKTSFKVVPDQLKLRRGLVRCGACAHVFSGIDFLRYVDESRPGRSAHAAVTAQPPDESLQTAFFLPETILAIAPAAPMPATQAPAQTDDEPPPDAAASAFTGDAFTGDAFTGDAFTANEFMADEFAAHALTAEDLDAGEDVTTEASTADESTVDESTVDESTADESTVDEAAADEPRTTDAIADAIGQADVHGDGPAFADRVVDDTRATAPGIPESDHQDTGEDAGDADDEDVAAAESIVAWGSEAAGPLDGAHEPIESLTATTPADFVDSDAFGTGELPAGVDVALADTDRYRIRRVGSGAGTRTTLVPDRASGDDESESAIDYFASGRRGIGFVDRHGPFALVAALLLVLLLGVQWMIAERSMIAARLPSLAPTLSAVLAPFGLRVGLPRDLGSLTIESFELQASAAPGVLAMSALLRNRAAYGVQWPSMQLTLTDATNRVLVRKVLGPEDYLRESHGGEGLPPRAEWPLRLALEAHDLQPAGYSVVLFYP